MRKTLKENRTVSSRGVGCSIIMMSWLNGVAWLISNYGMFTRTTELQ